MRFNLGNNGLSQATSTDVRGICRVCILRRNQIWYGVLRGKGISKSQPTTPSDRRVLVMRKLSELLAIEMPEKDHEQVTEEAPVLVSTKRTRIIGHSQHFSQLQRVILSGGTTPLSMTELRRWAKVLPILFLNHSRAQA